MQKISVLEQEINSQTDASDNCIHFFYQRLELEELKKMIGVDPKQYTRFNNFKICVLDTAQAALAEHTDICFEYIPIRAKGRKVLGIEFLIHKNKNYKHKKTALEQFMIEDNVINDDYDDYDDEIKTKNPIDYESYADMLENEFTIPQVEVLYQMAIPLMHKNGTATSELLALRMYNYLRLLYKRIKSSPNEVKHKFAYAKKLIECDLESMS